VSKRKKYWDLSEKLFWWCLLFSFMGHFIFLQIDFKKLFYSQKALAKPTEITLVKPEEIQALKERIRENNKGQVVNTQSNGRQERPKDSRFLGEKDQSFDRQTAAALLGSFKEAGRGEKTAIQKAAKPAPAKTQKGGAALTDHGSLALADLGIGKTYRDKESVAVSNKKPSKSFSGAELGLQKGKEGLTGLAHSNDYIEDLPLGDLAQLNTQEFKFFGFYDRIRKKLEQFWGVALREKAEILYRRGKKLPGDSHNITGLLVTIDHMGNITDVVIKSPSGIRELDDAAVESFNKAGPFPNPPKDMVKEGKAHIEWGFVVKS
jgi:TonB family protein